MIKGVRLGGMGNALSYLDKLVVPIIENTPREKDLEESMGQVRASHAIITSQLFHQTEPKSL